MQLNNLQITSSVNLLQKQYKRLGWVEINMLMMRASRGN